MISEVESSEDDDEIHLSRWSEDDLKNGALEQYRVTYTADFRHDQNLNILKHEPNGYLQPLLMGLLDSSNVESLINLDNDEVTTRQIGRHAAKKKTAKEKVANSSLSFGSVSVNDGDVEVMRVRSMQLNYTSM
ncbi:hypothetical protein L1887_11294 [Cichorium endivia]|nr:hypothetical protein L1887_11294 [Cichorium endivia]